MPRRTLKSQALHALAESLAEQIGASLAKIEAPSRGLEQKLVAARFALTRIEYIAGRTARLLASPLSVEQFNVRSNRMKKVRIKK